jgi:hypothetical protein
MLANSEFLSVMHNAPLPSRFNPCAPIEVQIMAFPLLLYYCLIMTHVVDCEIS